MKNISAWAIRHPISPIVLFMVLCFMGIVAFVRLPITLNPDIAYPLVQVQVYQPGGGPDRSRDPDHSEGRGLDRRRRQHTQHHLAGHRGPGADLR